MKIVTDCLNFTNQGSAVAFSIFDINAAAVASYFFTVFVLSMFSLRKGH